MASGTAFRHSIFELFTRRLPAGRRYGVIAGVGRAMQALADFRFGDEELAFLAEHHVVSGQVLDWLADYRFTGNIWGYPEGEMYFPGSPVMVGGGTLLRPACWRPPCSIYNYDSAVARRLPDDADGRRQTLHRDGRPADARGGVVAAARPRTWSASPPPPPE